MFLPKSSRLKRNSAGELVFDMDELKKVITRLDHGKRRSDLGIGYITYGQHVLRCQASCLHV
ncbi:hypothetical protein OH492_12690 [Vibrio chagasii]|nr:hypothetical protein [Vibrio chagasii]